MKTTSNENIRSDSASNGGINPWKGVRRGLRLGKAIWGRKMGAGPSNFQSSPRVSGSLLSQRLF